MTVTVSADGVIQLQGDCPLEDAEALLQRLSRDPSAKVDWTACTHIHTAVVQIMIAARPPVVGSPTDHFIRRHLAGLV